jgi:serine/threonine-protein kinase
VRDGFPELAAALSGHYRVEREIGAGGMATVYLARDLKHDRDVALKVMRPAVGAAVGIDRFLTEIKTTARLTHPHILPLFDSGAANGLLFYVMPFVDGESLKARVARLGPLPVQEVTRILRQIADALSYAHDHGIVHRDIKPDNVLIADGRAFVADFGIARAFTGNSAGATMTGTGAAVGTPAYMAPEQIVGGAVDNRADLYAFGALAYELLTGSPPFVGSSQDVVTAQLTREPEPVRRRRGDTPAPLAGLVMRCLEKDPANRPARAQELLGVFDAISGTQGDGLAAARPRRRGAVMFLVAGLAALSVVAIASLLRVRTPQVPTVGQITHVTMDPGLELDPALSPDGRTLAYVAGPPGRMRIYVRDLASGGKATRLTDDTFAGTERWPQWSPDGSRIVFQVAEPSRDAPTMGRMYVSTRGGPAREIAVVVPGGGILSPSWSPDGTRILFAASGGLYSMAVDGKTAPALLVSGSELHSPRWSPDGAAIAYVAHGTIFTFGAEMLGNVETSSLWMLNVGTGHAVQVTTGDSLAASPVWMPDSRTVLFVSSRGGGRDIYSVRLGTDGRPDQDPSRLTTGVNVHGISLASDGRTLVYSSYAPTSNIWSLAIPESGVASVADAQQVTFGNQKIEKLVVSPDGRWLAFDADQHGQADIWKVPIGGGTPEQITHGPYHKFVNEWSPDGQELVFHTMRAGGQRDVHVISVDGTHEEAVTTGPAEEEHAGWSPDGNAIVFDSAPTLGDRNEAYIARRSRRGAPWSAPHQVTKHGSSDPKWSPDGQLIAYCTDGQLWVIAPDGTGDRLLVAPRSTGDPEPTYPVWSRDSRVVYYKAYDRERESTIWAVPAAGGSPRLLVRFDVPSRRSLRREFATDGKRFYFTVANDESDLWSMELK